MLLTGNKHRCLPEGSIAMYRHAPVAWAIALALSTRFARPQDPEDRRGCYAAVDIGRSCVGRPAAIWTVRCQVKRAAHQPLKETPWSTSYVSAAQTQGR